MCKGGWRPQTVPAERSARSTAGDGVARLASATRSPPWPERAEPLARLPASAPPPPTNAHKSKGACTSDHKAEMHKHAHAFTLELSHRLTLLRSHAVPVVVRRHARFAQQPLYTQLMCQCLAAHFPLALSIFLLFPILPISRSLLRHASISLSLSLYPVVLLHISLLMPIQPALALLRFVSAIPLSPTHPPAHPPNPPTASPAQRRTGPPTHQPTGPPAHRHTGPFQHTFGKWFGGVGVIVIRVRGQRACPQCVLGGVWEGRAGLPRGASRGSGACAHGVRAPCRTDGGEGHLPKGGRVTACVKHMGRCPEAAWERATGRKCAQVPPAATGRRMGAKGGALENARRDCIGRPAWSSTKRTFVQ